MLCNAGLQKTCAAVIDEGYDIASYVVDLADRSAVYVTAEKVKKEVNISVLCSILMYHEKLLLTFTENIKLNCHLYLI